MHKTERSMQQIEQQQSSGAVTRLETALNILLYAAMVTHVLVCPYTKVEESFNLQAIHDILNHGLDLESYDHHTFPGVVPRTFLGPLLVSGLAWPLVQLARLAALSRFSQQVAARLALGGLVLASFLVFKRAVRRRFGRGVAVWLSLVTLSQFHLLFYSSRPLPNTLALVPVLLALSFWLSSQSHWFIVTAASAILILRGELAMFLGAILFMEIIVGKVIGDWI